MIMISITTFEQSFIHQLAYCTLKILLKRTVCALNLVVKNMHGWINFIIKDLPTMHMSILLNADHILNDLLCCFYKYN